MAGLGCVICGSGPEPGAGLYIRGHYICLHCELIIAGLRPGEPVYEFYKSGLKRIWRWA